MTRSKKHYCLVALQIVVALILVALFLSLYKYSERQLITESDNLAKRDMERIQLTIQREMQSAERAARAFSALCYEDGRRLPTDSDQYYLDLETFLSAMPSSITGAIIGFEDGVLPHLEHQWGFMPLVRHVNGKFIHYQMGGVRDVRAMHDWYRETKRLDRCRWAQPQLAEEGEVICGYCIPLHDANEQFIGVLEVDFSLESLSEEVCSIRSYRNSEPMVVDSDLTILISPEREEVLQGNMQSLLERRGLELENNIRLNVRNHIPGSYHLLQGTFKNPHDVYLYHCPEPYTGWTIQMTCFTKDVTEHLLSLKVRMSVIAVTVIGLLLLIVLTLLRNESYSRDPKNKN